ncbi:MAG: Rid family hydrolase [Burkholderia sp.]|nr:Rid family hydrolase [Burkholderia sp.]
MKRYGVSELKDNSSQIMPFSRAVEADGWLYVSGQMPIINFEVVEGGIVKQSKQAIENMISILHEAGYFSEHIVRCGVWLADARDFSEFNKVFISYFGKHLPARACIQSSMMIDCRVEIDCIAYKTLEHINTTV